MSSKANNKVERDTYTIPINMKLEIPPNPLETNQIPSAFKTENSGPWIGEII